MTFTDIATVLGQFHAWPLPLPPDVAIHLFDLLADGKLSTTSAPEWVATLAQQAIATQQLIEITIPTIAVALPVKINGETIGALALVGACAPTLAPPLATTLALLANKEDELEENTGRIQDIYEQILFLLTISKMVTSSAPRETLLRAGLKEGVELLRVQGGMILSADASQEAIVLDMEWIAELRAPLTTALQRHEGVVLCNTRDQCDAFCPALNGRIESLAAAEVWLYGEPELGLLLFNKQSSVGFLAADRQLVSFVAEQLQTVLRRDHLLATQAAQQRLNREIELASEIYQALVPHVLPQHPAFDLAVVSRPARDLGGDFYVVDQLPSGDLLLIVGDVAGKGLPAALMMSQTMATLRAVAYSTTSGPAQILMRSQRLLERMLDDSGLFVTVFVALFNPANGHLRYADAGHGHSQYRSAIDQTVQLLPATGTPLGSLFWNEIGEREMMLAPNDQLLVVSDGVIETPSAQIEQFSAERLSGLFGLVGSHTSQETLAQLEHSLSRFAESNHKATPAHDDVTALVMRRYNTETTHYNQEARTLRCFRGSVEEVTAFTLWMQGIALAINEWDATQRFSCVLATVECFTNVVRHAYATYKGDIHVEASASDTYLTIDLHDTGTRFHQPAVAQQPDPELLAEGGYGLHIIQSLTEQCDYHADASGNTWHLCYRR